jgi:hypothetical protein
MECEHSLCLTPPTDSCQRMDMTKLLGAYLIMTRICRRVWGTVGSRLTHSRRDQSSSLLSGACLQLSTYELDRLRHVKIRRCQKDSHMILCVCECDYIA